jgi:phage tail-like protein
MPTPISSASPVRNDPCTSGNFLIEIEGITASSFSEVSGLDASIDVIDYRAGDAKLYTDEKLPGLRKYANVILKRGFTKDASLWNWYSNVVAGNLTRVAVSIKLLDQADNPVVGWTLRNAWPCRWSGPVLVAGSPDVAIETVEICHEGLELVPQS